MTTLENFVSPALTQALGWTLLHSLWQGALVAGVLAGALLLMRRHRAEVRYLASGLALGSILVLAGLTFARYYQSATVASAVEPGASTTPLSPPSVRARFSAATAAAQPVAASRTRAAAPPTAAETSSWQNQALQYFDRHLPVLVLAWALGLLAMTLRMLGGLLYVQRLRRYRVQPLSPEWQQRLASLAARAGLKRPIALLESALVQVPLVVGHLRPVILLPLGTVAGLSPACLEAILAHELAHVVRRDYLMNLVQTAAEVLFFYHPAVWFMAACLRTERENCCDDAATSLVGGGLALARALTALAELGLQQAPAARLSLAAVGPDGSLLGRVRRLVQRRAAPTFAEGFLAACVVMAGLGLLGTAVSLAAPRAKQTTAAPDKAPTELAGPEEQQPAQEEKPAKRNKKGSTTQVVVVEPTGRNNPGTVIIEKDKKGRLTDLYVNGRHVAEASDSRAARKTRKGKSAAAADAAEAGTTWVWADNSGPGNSYRYSTVMPPLPPLEPELRRLDLSSLESARASLRSRQESLRTAERALAATGRLRSLSEEERSRVNEKRDGLREQLARLREEENELRRRTAELRRDANALRREVSVQERTAEAQLKEELLKEGLISDLKNFRLTLSSKEMTLNGVKQPEAVHRRYLERYEQLSGRKMTAGSQWMAIESNTSASAGMEPEPPLPPAPPYAPQAPQPGRGSTSQAERDRLQAERDRLQVERDRMRAERDLQRAERDKQRAERDRVRKEQSERTQQTEERIISELLKDGLVKDKQNYHFVLNSSELLINSQKQSDALHKKYRKLYESGTGRELGPTATVVLSQNGNHINRIYTTRSGADRFVTPPTPPAPLAPPAPPAPEHSRAVKVNSVVWGDELRRDGLIGPNDKSYSIELNNSGLTVNGKRQPDELARKYRALAGHADSKSFNMSLAITED
ncbi:hypothetical protein GCM10023185_30470 [Hymenobacter saemangeumensis]|uniref:Peptidase M56 domain-containing protein n=1 Tax=Hymenobacter saemangeumensis TaxID=1084522 RepID=A0ABP8IM72_9BACT